MVCHTDPASFLYKSTFFQLTMTFLLIFFLSSCFPLAFLNSLNTNCKNTKKKCENKLEKGLLFPVFRIL